MILVKNNSKLWKKVHENFVFEQAEKVTKILKIDGEISIVLTNVLEIKKLNKQYRKKDSPTNVLSFETGDLELLGDIVLAFETIKKESEEQKITFEKHLSLMICHGILHLIGYDHINNSDAEVMEKKEEEILEKI